MDGKSVDVIFFSHSPDYFTNGKKGINLWRQELWNSVRKLKKKNLLWYIISEINSSQKLSTNLSRREPAQQVTVSWTLPGIRGWLCKQNLKKNKSHFSI